MINIVGRAKSRVVTGGAALALFLVVAGIAYACTTFKGNMTTTQTGHTTASATGNNVGMAWCSTPAAVTGTLKTATTFTVSVSPNTSSNCGPADLGTDTDDVNYRADQTGHCMGGEAGTVPLGTISVSSGSGSASFLSPATTGSYTICISDLNNALGMEVYDTLQTT